MARTTDHRVTRNQTPRRPSRRHSLSRARRGVLLLLIISLLSLFALIGITYVISATHYRRGAEMLARKDLFGNDPKDTLDKAMFQVLVGPTNSRSVMLGHCMFADIYGHYGSGGTLGVVASSSGGAGDQLLELTLKESFNAGNNKTPFHRSLKDLGYAGGCVITMITGNAAGLSSHIVFQSLAGPSRVTVKPFVGDDLRVMSQRGRAMKPAAGDQYWINGQAFSGVGFGFNQITQQLDLKAQGEGGGRNIFEVPNFPAWIPGITDPTLRREQLFKYLGYGGANEEYDAPTTQDMLWAFVPSNKGGGGATADGKPLVTPSLHRPNLYKRFAASKLNVLRPLSTEHPQFTGSNPNFDPVRGPWDVDNDGDGTPDSVWVDLGFLVQTTADGRRYKPLFAIMCTPTNGGIDLNAAGSIAQIENSTGNLPHGIGTGPADINVNLLAGISAQPWIGKLLKGGSSGEQGAISWLGRYGREGSPGGARDRRRFWRTQFPQLPEGWNNWAPTRLAAMNYGTPPDFWASITITLEKKTGMPVYRFPERQLTPYLQDLGRNAPRGGSMPNARDNLYTYAEWERIMRQYDVDAFTLPQRLWDIMSVEKKLRERPRSYNAGSFDVPVPNVQVPLGLRKLVLEVQAQAATGGQGGGGQGGGGGDASGQPPIYRPAAHYVDLLKARMSRGGVPQDQQARLLTQYCPTEMLQGRRFNINRPLGNGRDDDNDGAVDNANDYLNPNFREQALQLVNGNPMALLNDALTDHEIIMARDIAQNAGVLDYIPQVVVRQVAIRQLYILMLTLITPSQAEYSWAGDAHLKLAREVAQWATNVIDFRDRDSIMTRFVYDPNPFDANGWNPPPANNRDSIPFTVYGVERPELIITEAIAGHDLRTEPGSGGGGGTPGGGGGGGGGSGGSLVQKRKPQQWMYIELYNPWTDREAQPGEFYKTRLADLATNGVVLERMAPPDSGGRRIPVWRLIAFKFEDDPDFLPNSGRKEGNWARGIYFDTEPINLPGDGTRNYWDSFRSTQFPIAPVRPGEYAVIGSRRDQYIGSGPEGALDEGSLQQVQLIRLTPSRNPDESRIQFRRNGGGGFETHKCVAVIVDRARSSSGTHSYRPIGLTFPGRSGEPGGISNRRRAENDAARWANADGVFGGRATSGYPDSVMVQKPGQNPGQTQRVQSTFVPAGRDRGRYSNPGPPMDPPALRVGSADYGAGFRVIHLQRLADPTTTFDRGKPFLNPYRTIDTMTVDLTVYNGLHAESNQGKPIRFRSRERGRDQAVQDPASNNLWQQEDRAKRFALGPVSQPDGSSNPFPYTLQHTLGFQNQPIGHAAGASGTGGGGAGGGGRPFPWLTWLNRPYANPMELLLVPSSNCYDLLDTYSISNPATAVLRDDYKTKFGFFGHLHNFFYVKATSGGVVAGGPELSKEWAMLFDFIQVPSLFLGTEQRIKYTGGGGAQGDPEKIGMPLLRAPFFNKYSSYREPGRTNLNFISERETLFALIDYSLDMEDSNNVWNRFVKSRAGRGSLDPTRFGAPFRSFSSSDLEAQDIAALATGGNLEKQGIGQTLMRPDTQQDQAAATPLFAAKKEQQGGRNPNRSPYFRYQALQRLSSTTTIRSNVFALWITTGNFEVLPGAGGDGAAGQGADQLGKEIGWENGTIQRHRAFYIIDRSIPVAFQPGRMNNVHRAIMVSRLID